jgi:hypothetical protein
MDCVYVFISFVYGSIGALYGYTIWKYLEVVDHYAQGIDS